jgi:hypothetical protein
MRSYKYIFAFLAAVLVTLMPLRLDAAGPLPVLNRLEPDAGAVGIQLVVIGQGFGTAPGVVWIGSTKAPVVSWSDTRIAVTVPQDASSGTVAVFNGADWSNPLSFTLLTPTAAENGIYVETVKVYDDQSLQQMLDSARTQLAGLRLLDQAGLAARIGSIQGASLQQSALAVNAGGPPIPGVVTTANTGNAVTTNALGGTTQQNTGSSVATQSAGNTNQVTSGTTPGAVNTSTANNQLQVTGPSTLSTSTSNAQSQVTGPSVVTATTQAPFNPTPPTLAPTSISLPSAFSPSASNVLNEQIELTYQIAGLEVLLEGALSDHYVRLGSRDQLLRRRATLGIIVNITPSQRYKDAVAEVIVDVKTAGNPQSNEPPSVTALLPRNKTYNVAAITDKSFSLGGAVATGVMSVGASWLRGHKTYYIVQDQDTVALQLPPATPNSSTTRFGWQFRPVLGQRSVQGGPRESFVQLAFPVLARIPSFGTVQVTTLWKHYDRKTGIVDQDPIPGSVSTIPKVFDVLNFDTRPLVGSLEAQDQGDGTLNVTVSGDYTTGTVVRLGTTTIPTTALGVTFNAAAVQLATQPAYLVDRTGQQQELINPLMGAGEPCLSIPDGGVQTSLSGTTTALVTVRVALSATHKCRITNTRGSDLVAVVGNKVFGLRDAPFKSRTDDSLSFVLPVSALQTPQRVTVERLLWGPRLQASADIGFAPPPVISQAIVVAQSAAELKIALMGSGLSSLVPVSPQGAKLDPLTDAGAILSIPLAQSKGLKQVVLKDRYGELQLVALPADQSAAEAIPKLEPHAALKAGPAMAVTIKGSGLSRLTAIKFDNQKLPMSVAKDKKSVTVHLPKSFTGRAGTPELEFLFEKSETVKYPISVFDQKVEIPPPSSSSAASPPAASK